MQVAVQKHRDLDTTFELALLHKELGAGMPPAIPVDRQHRAQAFPLPPPHRQHAVDNRKTPEHALTMDDKWSALRNL